MAETAIRPNAERGLLLAILLSAVTLVLEIAGGILSGSLALLSDAVHVLLDLLSLLRGSFSFPHLAAGGDAGRDKGGATEGVQHRARHPSAGVRV